MTANGTLDERYLTWIHRQLEPDTQRNPARSHWVLCAQLYQTEFTWYIPNDDNRLYDGLDIRQEFVDAEEGGDVPGMWFSEACSVLEVLIALGRRMAFETDLEADYWFWKILENMNIRQYVDDTFDDDTRILIDSVLSDLVNRAYNADGTGGMFPLIHASTDQRKTEIWSQMNHYLMENIVI